MWIDGRKLDDITDYLNYSFVPLVLVAWAGWLPQPAVVWAAIAAVTSAFAFVNIGAKEEAEGFFLGFPSYWNVFAIYVLLWFQAQPYLVLFFLLLFSVMTLLPLRFVYPSHFRRWKIFFVGGGALWWCLVTWILWVYPTAPSWIVWLSAGYPVGYMFVSVWLDWQSRRSL